MADGGTASSGRRGPWMRRGPSSHRRPQSRQDSRWEHRPLSWRQRRLQSRSRRPSWRTTRRPQRRLRGSQRPPCRCRTPRRQWQRRLPRHRPTPSRHSRKLRGQRGPRRRQTAQGRRRFHHRQRRSGRRGHRRLRPPRVLGPPSARGLTGLDRGPASNGGWRTYSMPRWQRASTKKNDRGSLNSPHRWPCRQEELAALAERRARRSPGPTSSFTTLRRRQPRQPPWTWRSKTSSSALSFKLKPIRDRLSRGRRPVRRQPLCRCLPGQCSLRDQHHRRALCPQTEVQPGAPADEQPQ